MTEHAFEAMRRAMVANQLRTTGVSDPRVVAAMAEVPRERFVPVERRALAYADALVPVGHGRYLNPPMPIGRLLTEARLQGSERALVVGAATGYSAAVLARLVAKVTAVEEVAELADAARFSLEGSGVEVVTSPLTQGHEAGAPYDFILIDGAVEQVPDSLVAQARDGGSIALALLDGGVTRLAIGRAIAGSFGATAFADAATAILPGFQLARGFAF